MPKGETSRPYNKKMRRMDPKLAKAISGRDESKRKLGATLEKNKIETKKLMDSIFPKEKK